MRFATKKINYLIKNISGKETETAVSIFQFTLLVLVSFRDIFPESHFDSLKMCCSC